MGMPESTEQEAQRRREAVEREMQRRREAEEERESHELVDTVGEEQQRGRERDRAAAERDED
jgi:hypothetical protein